MSTTTSERDDTTAERIERHEVQVVITQQLPYQPLPGEILVNAPNNFSVFTNDQERASQYFQKQREEEKPDQNETSSVEVYVLTEDERKRHLKLFRAAVSGDWMTAEAIFENHPEDIRARISKTDDTPLHIAAAANRTHFVEQMVKNKHMTADDLETMNLYNNTAFCLAAASGNTTLVDLMLDKNPKLTQIRGVKDMLPIQMAALLGHENMVRHLYENTKTSFKGKDLINLLVTVINNDLYGTALKLLDHHPGLATESAENEETALHALAKKPLPSSDLANPNQQGSLQSFFNLCLSSNL